ncbi:MAG TPA: pyrroloquinoline-quinone synthase PqqC [Polyangiaceae bacterium]|nr:pyrroloquinoline-quinone synthase PqqC [Polyangiaceae bacterium]
MSERAFTEAEFVERLRTEGQRRYHDQHPFHELMHEGGLSREQLQAWTLNRFYYQTRIPIKDAVILSKTEDAAFRRIWIERVRDHDGREEQGKDGGLELWLRLAEAVGLDRAEVASLRGVLPGVRFACDAYVTLCRESPVVVAVASSLTEMFAPDLMSKRIAAWERFYPWVGAEALAYFRSRVPRARRDGEFGLAYVVAHARSRELQDACVAALVTKAQILWHLVDTVASATGGPTAVVPGAP